MSDDIRRKVEYVLKLLDIDFEFQTRKAFNVACPFCDDSGKHCGIFVDTDRPNFNCWKCGTSGAFYELLQEYNSLPWDDYKSLMESPEQVFDKTPLQAIQEILGSPNDEVEEIQDVSFPPEGAIPIDLMSVDRYVQDFLTDRKLSFDFCSIQQIHIGVTGRYANRFIIPVYQQGEIVAFQARHLQRKYEPKYLSAGDVSNFVYGIDHIDPNYPAAITEGILDSWSTPNSGATFTTSISDAQICLMGRKNPIYWVLCWDMGEDGSDAFWKGRKAVFNLAGHFGASKIRSIALPKGKDPDNLGPEIMQSLIDNAQVVRI